MRPPRRFSVLDYEGLSTRKEVGRMGDERVEGLVLGGDEECCDEGCCDEGCC